ncbi:MAG: DUF3300 domain-containing protein [Candidatus Korobacteraceae bacterium]
MLLLSLSIGTCADYASAAQEKAQPAQQASSEVPPEQLSNDQLDSLVAPIALYPDPLLSQTLVASTYPLEIVQLQQWLEKNKDLKGDALAKEVQKQDWDPSIYAMAQFPDLVKQLGDSIKWTTDLGNAFLAQQSDVMDAVQRMRAKAEKAGKLKSSEQQKVETQVIDNKSVVVIQPSNPEVIYVPTYNPTVVYGAPVYPYPPIYYPPPGYYAAGMAMSFGVGVAMGAAWGGGWGWNAGWGGNNNVVINRNNTFVRNYDRQNINRGQARTGNNWQHNSQHRGGTPYSNRATAQRYGGSTRGDTVASRQSASSRQAVDRSASRAQSGSVDRNMGGERVGNRSVSRSASGSGSSAFGGASSFSGGGARASSQRGSSSRSGGMRAGGGGRRR